jgi:hypothetical protein
LNVKGSPLDNYLLTRAITGPWRLEGCEETGFEGAVVIPALAEEDNLFATLASLAANPLEFLARFLVLVVVNHRIDAPPADRENNCRTLARLAALAPELAHMRLSWVNAATPGLEMSIKSGGVGLARKIGLDLALTRIDLSAARPLLVCLDADTLVEPSYFPALVAHFRDTPAGGAAIPFRHQPGRTPEEQSAIVCYELFLRHYILGLKLAGSPYAFHTVGSAMACTAGSYIKAGGMNRRAAGEDFYFLQHLFRTSGVARVQGTVVHPSPRPSHRVPFGTGRAVSRRVAGDVGAITFYRSECFSILGKWLEIAEKSLTLPLDDILRQADRVSVHLADFLEESRFPEIWAGLRGNHSAPERLLSAFHGWFDGLRTMKLIHHLSARGLPRCGPTEAIPPLCAMAGIRAPDSPDMQLALLRRMEHQP